MITVTKLRNNFMVEYAGQLHIVTSPTFRKRGRKDTLKQLRHAICKALKLNSTDFRFIGNRRNNGIWITEWLVL